jgi:hypothetical protein
LLEFDTCGRREGEREEEKGREGKGKISISPSFHQDLFFNI